MRKLLLFLFLCLSATFIQAQNHTITGKVTDDKGNPIAGASVQIKNTKKGVMTNANGIFIVTVPSSANTLVISSVNFVSKEVAISDNLSVTLTSSSGTMSEVVVVAYGTQKKTNVTGSFTTVKAADIENKPFTSVDKALQGAVAGLQSSSFSGAPGAATDIIIRGIGSISAGSAPLWVIDGVIATTGDLTSNTTTANALSALNSDDIESITVLKDAAATAVYGSRAGNGVILVTTKKGRAGRTSLNFSTEIGENSIAFTPENKPLNSIQTRTLLRQSLINAGYAANDTQADYIILNDLGIPADYTSTNTNWKSVVTHPNAPQSQYNLSLNGGDEKTQFYASAGFFKQDGTTIATDFNRYNGNVSITHKVADNLTFTAGLSGSTSMQNTPLNSGTFGNPVLAADFLLPWYTPYNPDGSLRYNDPQQEFPLNGGLFNPVVQAAYNKYQDNQTTFRGNVSGEYKILDNLKITSRFSAEYFDILENSYENPFYGDGYADGGDVFSNYRRTFDWTWSNFADYTKTLNSAKDIYFDVKAGVEAYQLKDFFLQASGKVTPETLALTYLATTGTPSGAYSVPDQITTNSVFSVADFNIKDRYVISGSFRRDGSSNFGADHRWGNFYSIGATWNINEEDFLKNSRTISLLKLRASYGETGNSGIGYYAALPLYGYGSPYDGQPGSLLSNIGNPNLTWEKNAPLNIGADIALWKNRFYTTVDYYDRKTSNLLLAVPLSLTSGVSSQLQNVGAMENKGIEITVGGRPIQTKDFSWDVSFNFSHNVNRVTALYSGATTLGSGGSLFDVTVGHDIQEYYLREWAGVNPANGSPLWYTNTSKTGTSSDVSSSDSVPQNLTGLSASPKYFGSLTSTFTYKGLSLEVQFYYNYGNYIYQLYGNYNNSDGGFIGAYNQFTQQLTAWQKPGDITNVPQIVFGDPSNSSASSTRYLYNGDYVRLRNLQLSYTIPKSALQFKRWHISNLVVYMRGTNLITWVKDKTLPFDPEQGAASNDNLDVYIPKTIALGLKIGL